MPQSSQPSLMTIVYPFFSIRSFGQTGIHFSHTPHSSKSITINLSPHKLFYEFCQSKYIIIIKEIHFINKLLNLFNTILNYNILSLYNFVNFL